MGSPSDPQDPYGQWAPSAGDELAPPAEDMDKTDAISRSAVDPGVDAGESDAADPSGPTEDPAEARSPRHSEQPVRQQQTEQPDPYSQQQQAPYQQAPYQQPHYQQAQQPYYQQPQYQPDPHQQQWQYQQAQQPYQQQPQYQPDPYQQQWQYQQAQQPPYQQPGYVQPEQQHAPPYPQNYYGQHDQYGQQAYQQQAAPPPAAMPTTAMPAYDPAGDTQFGQQHYGQQSGYGHQQFSSPHQGSGEWAAESESSATDGAEKKSKKSPSKKVWVGVVGAVVAVAAIIVVGFAVPGPLNIKDRLTKQVLSQEAIQNGVLGELEKAGVPVDTVKCPANVEVKENATFTCDATINGVVKKVESTITSTDGDYTVMVPSGY